MNVLVEACVTTVDEARAAEGAGAHRLELCRDLSVDGLSPSAALVGLVLEVVAIPVFVMIRPRAGGFVYTSTEVEEMLAEIQTLAAAGAAGVVCGLLAAAGRVDAANTRRLVEAARPLPVTFHRAFDQADDQLRALEAVAEAGVTRILTGGGPGRAIDQADRLAELVRMAGDSVTVLAGGGVRGDHVADLIARTGATEVHARAAGIPGIVQALRG
ncbi:MAG: copper homeostasis protein CutC [Gemmatimonadetes bacterium]|nr:copper homeostasis protein CutC [Gemmatimonadota bacterium]